MKALVLFIFMACILAIPLSIIGQENLNSKNFVVTANGGAGYSTIRVHYIEWYETIETSNDYYWNNLIRPFVTSGLEYKKKIGFNFGVNFEKTDKNTKTELLPFGKVYGIFNTSKYSRFTIGMGYGQYHAFDRSHLINIPTNTVTFDGLGPVFEYQIYGLTLDLSFLGYLSNNYEPIGHFDLPKGSISLRLSYEFLGLPNRVEH